MADSKKYDHLNTDLLEALGIDKEKYLVFSTRVQGLSELAIKKSQVVEILESEKVPLKGKLLKALSLGAQEGAGRLSLKIIKSVIDER